jgi:hypothetical protein
MEKVYAEGIRTFKKSEKSPDFVLGTVVISIDDLVKWCDNNYQHLVDYKGKRQLKLQLLKGKEANTVVFQVDTYKKDLPF